MPIYSRILVAVNLEAGARQIGQRARELALGLDAELRLLHVVPPCSAKDGSSEAGSAEELLQRVEVTRKAQKQMEDLARELGVTGSKWQVIEGDVQDEILQAVREHHADLLIVGTRERHGRSPSSGEAEESVAHRPPCDVLEVRLSD
jgi:universal stress protein A